MTVRWPSFCRLLCTAACLSLAGQALGAAIFGLDPVIRALPGPARVVCREGKIDLGNRAIALGWTATKQGLKAPPSATHGWGKAWPGRQCSRSFS